MTDDKASASEELRRDDLVAAARELKAEVAELRQDMQVLNRRTTRAEKVSGRAKKASGRASLTAGVLLVIVALLGGTVWQQYQISGRLELLTQRSLCPLFALVVGGYDPSTRPEGVARDRYVATFASFRVAYDELRCIAPLVPPRIEGGS